MLGVAVTYSDVEDVLMVLEVRRRNPQHKS